MARGRPKPGPCVNCGITPDLARHGRCRPCYDYWRRHGQDRLINAVACLLCEKPTARAAGMRRGYCWRCYSRLRRRNFLTKLPRGGVRPCAYCGLETIKIIRGWCKGCYNRWLQTGKIEGLRPPRVTHCRNCGNARNLARVRRDGARGLCRPCYLYEIKYGRPRPERVWKAYVFRPRGRQTA